MRPGLVDPDHAYIRSAGGLEGLIGAQPRGHLGEAGRVEVDENLGRNRVRLDLRQRSRIARLAHVFDRHGARRPRAKHIPRRGGRHNRRTRRQDRRRLLGLEAQHPAKHERPEASAARYPPRQR